MTRGTQARKILAALAVIFVVWVIALAVTACNAFVGPATAIDDTYMIHCGEESCNPSYYECSNPWYPPSHCVQKFQYGAAKDGGK